MLIMSNDKPHPLLAQIPLAVSPFISLPSAPTLPYTYKPLPSTLPPSSTADQSGQERDKYVVAPSGHAAHPDEIIASCQAIQAHIQKVQDDAERMVKEWEGKLREEELAEKRRVAPGWLDREEKLLEPSRANAASVGSMDLMNDGMMGGLRGDEYMQSGQLQLQQREQTPDPAGEELDRAFGAMRLVPKN